MIVLSRADPLSGDRDAPPAGRLFTQVTARARALRRATARQRRAERDAWGGAARGPCRLTFSRAPLHAPSPLDRAEMGRQGTLSKTATCAFAAAYSSPPRSMTQLRGDAEGVRGVLAWAGRHARGPRGCGAPPGQKGGRGKALAHTLNHSLIRAAELSAASPCTSTRQLLLERRVQRDRGQLWGSSRRRGAGHGDAAAGRPRGDGDDDDGEDGEQQGDDPSGRLPD